MDGHEKSCGTILFRKTNGGGIRFLLLFQRKSRTWSFPKGHVIGSESEMQTALRETEEETGLNVSPLGGFRESLSYEISSGRRKEVVLFLARADEEPCLRESEIVRSVWAGRDEAAALLIHPEYRGILSCAEKAAEAAETPEAPEAVRP